MPCAKIAIIDYGIGNLRSVQKGFAQVGAEADIVSQPEQIDSAEKIILPGIGAFKDAMGVLRERKLDQAIVRHVTRGKPLLGICLGLQLLFETGYEDGTHKGLGIVKGDCVRFDVDTTLGLKVPHMGWNQLILRHPTPLMRDLPDGCSVYFVHGYYVVPMDASVIATETDYGRPFVSSIRQGNVMATQFHPEKSQRVGLAMLKNFAEWRA